MTETAPASAAQKGGKAKTGRNTTHKCRCLTGTGKQCSTATENSFGRGHDARMSSRLANEVAQGKTKKEEAEKHMRAAGGSDLLVGKMHRAAERLAQPKTERKAADKPAKGKAAKTEGGNPKNVVTVKHGSREYKATVVTNAQQERVARHQMLGKNCDHDLEV